MRKSEIDARFDSIVDFAEVEKFIDTAVKWYSSGMYVRLAFAVAAHLDPEILVIDEVLAVGDVGFQAKCLNKMGDAARSGRTVLFVSHSMTAVERLCDRVIVLANGEVTGVFDDPREGVGHYLGRGKAMSTIWTNPGNGSGNGYFTPHRLEVDGDGTQNHAITLIVDGTVHQSDPALQIGFYIYDEAEQLIFMSFSSDSLKERWPQLDPGPIHLCVTIPPHWLNEGTYRAELAATLFERQWLLEPGSSAFVILRGGQVQRVTVLEASGSAVNMATDDECLRVAHEYVRLAGLTKQRNVQDQLLDLARGWTAIAQHERRSDGARVLRFTPATTSPETPRSKRQVRHIAAFGTAVLEIIPLRLCIGPSSAARPLRRVGFDRQRATLLRKLDRRSWTQRKGVLAPVLEWENRA